MKLDRNKIFSFMLAAVFALALAGCGGGGSGTTDTPDPTPMPDPALGAAQSAAQTAAAAAATAATNTSDNPAASSLKEVADDAAAMARAAAMAAAGATDVATAEEERDKARAQQVIAEAAMEAAMALVADLPATPPATAEMVMAKAMGIMALDAKTDDANTADVTETKDFGHHVLNDADPAVYVAQAPFDGAANGPNMYTVSAMWKDGAAMATVTDGGANASEDGPAVADAEDNTQDAAALMMSTDMPHAIDGWAGSIHTKEMSTEKVIVYTDIMAPTPTEFGEVHNLDANTDGSENDGLDETNPATALIVSIDSAPATTDVLALLSGDKIVAPVGKTTVDIMVDDPDTPAKENEFSGMYQGADGKYVCAGGACTLTFTGEDLSGVAGTLLFIPAEGAMVDVADTDHLHFGFWVKPPAEGEDAYSIQTFTGGSDSYDTALSGTQTSLTGSAEYTGKAAGVYAQKTTFNAETGALEGGSVGAFTGNVSLMAYFGTSASTPAQDDVAVNDQNTIRGEISDLMDGDNALPWTVELMRTKFGAATGMTKGGGAWTHSFFGPHQDADGAAVMPSGVAGEFTGHFSNGHVAGAYGASKVMEE